MHHLIPETTVIWYSGKSKSNARGVIMAYIPAEDQYLERYAEFKSPNWNISKAVGVSKDEIETIINTNVV